MYKKVVSLFFVLALILVHATSVTEAKSNKVPEKIADKVAKDYVKKLKFDLKFQDKTDVIPIYDLDDNEFGYYYQFENGDKSYFLLLSSNTEYSVLFAAGKGKPSIKRVDKNGKYYYFGNTTLFEAEDGSSVVESLNNLNREKSTQITRKDLNIKKNPNAQTQWENYFTNNESPIVRLSSVSESYINDVRIFNQWDSDVDYPASSCGPTTVATISEYWRTEENKSSIRGLNYYNSEADMINHVYNSHGGTPYGMTVSGVKRALNEHITEKESYTVTTDSFNSFSSYKSEIRADRPLAVKFDDWFVIDDTWGDEYVYDYHWTVGVGYYTDGIDDLLFIHDNAGDEKYIDYATHEEIITMVSVDVD